MISHQKNEVICNVCGKELADKKTLYKHKAIHSNSGNSGHSWFEKLFPCSSCEKVSILFYIIYCWFIHFVNYNIII